MALNIKNLEPLDHPRVRLLDQRQEIKILTLDDSTRENIASKKNLDTEYESKLKKKKKKIIETDNIKLLDVI